MSMQQVVNELREIKDQLKPEPTYIERFTRSKATVQSTFDGTLKVDGQGFNLYIISTDGNIADISYQVRNVGGEKVDEMEAQQFAYIPGPVETIDFKNDVAEAGKSIFITAYKISRLAPPMPPPSAPGTPSELVDPHLGLGGTGVRKIELPFDVSKFTGVSDLFTFTFDLTDTKQYSQLEKPKGTLDFAVTTAKRLILFYIHILTATATKGCGLAYGDDAVDNSATGPTNTVDLTQGSNWHNATAEETFEGMGCFVFVPAGKVPHISAESTSGNLSGQVLGVEVDA